MTTSEDRPELRVLSSDDCYRLLATQQIGRLGVNAEHYPLIFPVNYTLDQSGVIVIRTNAGAARRRGCVSVRPTQADAETNQRGAVLHAW